MSATSIESDWKTAYETFIFHKDKAYKAINDAFTLINERKYNEAVVQYELALVNIDKALPIKIEWPTDDSYAREKTRYATEIQEMKSTRKDVLCQVADCQTKLLADRDRALAPPSYEEAISTSSSSYSNSNAFNIGSSNSNLPSFGYSNSNPSSFSYFNSNPPSYSYSNSNPSSFGHSISSPSIYSHSNSNPSSSNLNPSSSNHSNSNPSSSKHPPPNPYNSTYSNTNRMDSFNHTSLTYNELGFLLDNMKINTGAQSSEVILSIDNVNTFCIRSDGTITNNSELNTLKIFKLDGGGTEREPKYVIQCGSYFYPLLSGISPCVRAEYGAILLPNTDGDTNVIALMIPEEHEEEVVNLLENILNIKLIQGKQTKPESSKQSIPECGKQKTPEFSKPTTPESGKSATPEIGKPTSFPRSTSISNYITSGAVSFSEYLLQGAQKTEHLLNDTTPKLIDKLEQNSAEIHVSPKFQHGIKVARDVTAKTANVTGIVASKLGTASAYLGQYLAPHVKRGSSTLLSRSTSMSNEDAARKLNDVIKVTGDAVQGFGTIYEALEQSATILGNSLRRNTVHVVKHKYGNKVGEVTDDTFVTVGHGIQIGNHISVLKPKNLCKTVAKEVITAENESAASSSPSRRSRKHHVKIGHVTRLHKKRHSKHNHLEGTYHTRLVSESSDEDETSDVNSASTSSTERSTKENKK